MARNKDHAGHSAQGGGPEERKDWRRKSARGTDRRRASDGEGWHAGNRPTPRFSQYRYLVRLMGMTAILALLLSTWFFYVIRRHKQVPLYTVVVTEYTSPYSENVLPPNSLAYEDLQLFQEMFQRRAGSGLTRNVGLVKLGEGSYKRTWLQEEFPRILAKDKGNDVPEPGGPGDDVVMFYISAHGAVNAQGKACLLLTDSDPLDCSTWVPVVEVLTSISKVERFSDCKKIVFLDASRMCENWQMGLLCNTFSQRVAEAVQSVNDARLIVFDSADIAQTAWPEPEEACTAFGRAVASGLAGGADTSGWLRRVLGLTDITLKELAEYIVDDVRNWSQRERGAYQTPTVHFAGGDSLPNWKLADSAGKSVADVDRRSQIETLQSVVRQRVTDISELWEKMDLLARENAVLSDPLKWASLQTSLVQLESLMVAGTRYDTQYATLKSNIDERLSNVSGDPADGSSRLELPNDTDNRQANSADQDVSCLPLLRRLRTVRGEQDSLSRQRTQWASNPDSQGEQWKDLHYIDAIDISTQWLEQMPSPTRDDIARAVALADRCRGSRAYDVVEVQFLRMLVRDTLPDSTLREQINAAMNCRFLAERAAVPPDPRALYWIEDTVRQADPARRMQEDQLLRGDQSPARLEQWKSLQTDYARAESIGTEVTEVLRIRDRAWADITGLAMWKMRDARKNPNGQQEAIQILLDLIRQVHQLDALLVQREGNWSPNIQDLAKQVSTGMANLRAQYNKSVGEIINNDANDADSLHRMAVILAAPLRCGVGESLAANPNESRGAVLKRYVECLFRRQSAKATEDDSATSQFLQETLHWDRHPLSAIVNEAQGSGEAKRLDNPLQVGHWEKQETELRAFFKAKLPQALSEAVAATVTDLRGENEDPTKRAHQRLRESEHLFRGVAPVATAVLNSPPNDELNPVRLTRQIAQLRQFLWQDQRTLNDCYLIKQGGDDKSPAFVQLASAGYENAAEKMEVAISSGLPRNLRFHERIERISGDDLGTLSATRSQAHGLLVEASGIQLRENDDDLHDASAEEVSHAIEVPAAPELPADGLGFLELTFDDGKPFPVQDAQLNQVTPTLRHSISTQADPRQFQFTVRRTELVDVSNLEVRSYFRGGWQPQPIWIRGPKKGLKVVYPSPEYQLPRMTVEGDSTKPALIVFVFDCSASMADKIARERGGTEIKMERARVALLGILGNLLQFQKNKQGKYLVGLVVYGHRSNWRKGIRKATDNVADFDIVPGYPKNIHPNNDVETIPDALAPLTDDTVNLMRTRITALEPWGVTPLYAALNEAIGMISRTRGMEACSKHIIAITDGVNETPATANATFQVTSGSVIQRATENPDVQIDIVGFDVRFVGDVTKRMSRNEFDALKNQLDEITRNSHGEYYPASEPGELTTKLQNAIKPAEVGVQYKASNETTYQTGQSFSLGTTWIDEAWQGQTDHCKLTIQEPRSGLKSEAEVDLEGGEHLRLIYDGSALVHQQYQSADLRPDDPRPNVGGNFYIASLVPQWDGDELVFRVMVRNKNAEQFSPRPKQVWAEITPVSREPSDTYVFYDLEFENDTQVPVLRLRTLDWPANVDKAHIRLWFQMENSDAQADLDEPITKFRPDQRFPIGIEGIEFEVEPQRLSTKTGDTTYVVWEHYDASHRSDMPLTRVKMTPTPAYTEHEYRREDGNVRHLFRYSARANPLSVLRLQVTSKARICEARTTVSITDNPLEATLPPRKR